jgi:hypothetical protein
MKTNLITITNLADAYARDLFILRLAQNDDHEYDFEKLEDRVRYYEHNEVFALGKLTGNHYAAFERKFGRSLDRFQSQWLAAVLYEASRSRGETLESVTYSEDENTYYTPAGKLVGSTEINMLQCIAFLFSCFGRVVGETEDGEYELEQVSQDEVMDYIDLNLLESAAVVDGDEQSFVWRVLGTARGFSVYAQEEDGDEQKDDDLKNSTPESENSPSTKSTSKRSRAKKQ